MLSALALVTAACAQAEDGGATTTQAPTPAPTQGGGGDTGDAGDAEEPADAGDSLAGTTVTIFGPESSDEEAGSFQDALDVFAERTGINVEYTGARDFSDQINAQAAGGNPPDIAIIPQPGKVADFARQGFILPLPDDVVEVLEANWDPAWVSFGNVDGTQYGVMNKSDIKSLVWYNVAEFEAGGYEVPQTWDDLKALTDQMVADGKTPWCVGIESGPATGWPFTDWVEDLMLRFYSADVYDQWVNHEIPFNDDRVVAIFEEVASVWNTPGAVYAAGGSIAATPFGDNGQPLAEGLCLMHRQASFFSAFLPEGTPTGPEGVVNVFFFPPGPNGTRPVLGGGTVPVAFRDAPEVWEVMKYLASAEYANVRAVAQSERKGGALSGFLSANKNVDLSNWLPLEQSMIQIMQTAEILRFDGSDLMPAAVGAGTFWTEGTSFVNGEKTAQEAADAIEASWPSS